MSHHMSDSILEFDYKRIEQAGDNVFNDRQAWCDAADVTRPTLRWFLDGRKTKDDTAARIIRAAKLRIRDVVKLKG